MKPLVAAAALEDGVFTRKTRIFCENGAWKPRRGRTITDAHGYGWLSFSGAVIKSSNIGLAKVGRKMGARRLERYCRAFGFGRLSGLGLPGESKGILRPLRSWTRDSVLSIPFGHEISVTPLQLATAYGALANGGVLYRPQLIERIERIDGRKLQDFPPAPIGRVISQKTSADMREILKGVVERGTGKRARLKDWSVAGKTGTARKLVNGRYSDKKHFSSFVGFAPAARPRLVVLVTVDEPKGAYYGGTVAGPAVAAVLRNSLISLGVAPERANPLADARGGRSRRGR
jgi:cell division protein FtsI (penicillin-binding protein 3)